MSNIGKRVIYRLTYSQAQAQGALGNNPHDDLPGIIVGEFGLQFNVKVFADGPIGDFIAYGCYEGIIAQNIIFLDPRE